MKNHAGRIFFGGSLQVYFTNLVEHKPAFLHHLWGKQNYQALFVYHSDIGSNLCHFIYVIILQDKLHFDIQDDWSIK